MSLEKKNKLRFGVNRWLVLAVIIISILAARFIPPVRPTISLAPEKVVESPLFTSKVIGDFYLTNTLIALVFILILIFIIGLVVRSGVKKAEKSGALVLPGLAGIIEMIVEYLYNLTESTSGKKWAGTIFPWFFTITFTVLLANLMELFPGVETIGFIRPTATGGAGIQALLPWLWTLVRQTPGATSQGYELVPFIRTLSTDLNFTLALAIIAVIMIQVVGIKAQGIRYFTKFWSTGTLFKKPLFGVIDFASGILEFISEIAKVLSFSFRLLGNIFAGGVILFVVGALVPVFAQSIFVGWELFVGIIQAIVFGMLTMVFMSMAVRGHGEAKENTRASATIETEKN